MIILPTNHKRFGGQLDMIGCGYLTIQLSIHNFKGIS